MSMLNKFITPELKIKSKGSKGAHAAAASAKHPSKPSFGIAAVGKSGMTLRNFGFLKTPVSGQSVPSTGGGKK